MTTIEVKLTNTIIITSFLVHIVIMLMEVIIQISPKDHPEPC